MKNATNFNLGEMDQELYHDLEADFDAAFDNEILDQFDTEALDASDLEDWDDEDDDDFGGVF